MLAAHIVGPSGSVIGIERDVRTIRRAQTRVAEAGIINVEFLQRDLDEYAPDGVFDALVGRYVLQFLPKPAATLRSVAKAVIPGGIVAFQEGSWAPFLALSSHLPLWSAAVSLLYEAGLRSGVHLEMGPGLFALFQDAGLPAPRMRLVMELGSDPDFTRWLSDSLKSVLPKIESHGLSYGAIGDFNTLQDRLDREVTESGTVVPWLGLVEASCRKP
jgi:ubiquinone/menaquinone biosynthesis C-methylase UbiE